MVRKKICSIVLLLVMLFMVSACGTDSIDTSDVTEPQKKAATTVTSKKESTTVQEPVREPETAYDYIGNKNSGKLHYPDCSSVKRMKATNKAYLDCTRSEAISRGYEPCQKCCP